MEQEQLFNAAIIAIGLLVCIVSVRWARKDLKKQMIAVDGANYRKKYGLFDVLQYILGNSSATVPKEQNNSGPDPKTYDKKIPYVDHFGALDCSISEKRKTK